MFSSGDVTSDLSICKFVNFITYKSEKIANN